jgi:hypothetical protein
VKNHATTQRHLFFTILSIAIMVSISTAVQSTYAQPLITHLQDTNQAISLSHEGGDITGKIFLRSQLLQWFDNIRTSSTAGMVKLKEPRFYNTEFSHILTHADATYETYLQKPTAISEDIWEIFLQLLSFIKELADFLYRAVEPFIVIIFTLLYAVNPPLAILFVVFMLLLRIISLLDIPSETTLNLLSLQDYQIT